VTTEHKPHSELLAKVLKEHEYRTHGGRTNFIQVCETCDAIRCLEEQLETLRAEHEFTERRLRALSSAYEAAISGQESR